MKKLICLVLVVLIAWVPLFMGAYRGRGMMEIQPVYSSSPGSQWIPLGTITASNSALGVDALDYSSVDDLPDANTVDWDIPEDADNVEMRFQTDADDDDHVLNLYIIRGSSYTDGTTEDSYVLSTILTLKGGTQVGPNSNVFCDTVTETQDYCISGTSVDTGATERIGRYIITKLRGYKKMVIIATTLETSGTIYIDGAWYSNED